MVLQILLIELKKLSNLTQVLWSFEKNYLNYKETIWTMISQL